MREHRGAQAAVGQDADLVPLHLCREAFLVPEETQPPQESDGILEEVLDSLNSRERESIRLRYLVDAPLTFREIGTKFGVCWAMGQVYVNRALKKLRHPCRIRLLKTTGWAHNINHGDVLFEVVEDREEAKRTEAEKASFTETVRRMLNSSDARQRRLEEDRAKAQRRAEERARKKKEQEDARQAELERQRALKLFIKDQTAAAVRSLRSIFPWTTWIEPRYDLEVYGFVAVFRFTDIGIEFKICLPGVRIPRRSNSIFLVASSFDPIKVVDSWRELLRDQNRFFKAFKAPVSVCELEFPVRNWRIYSHIKYPPL